MQTAIKDHPLETVLTGHVKRLGLRVKHEKSTLTATCGERSITFDGIRLHPPVLAEDFLCKLVQDVFKCRTGKGDEKDQSRCRMYVSLFSRLQWNSIPIASLYDQMRSAMFCTNLQKVLGAEPRQTN